jgi:hypothetical protein
VIGVFRGGRDNSVRVFFYKDINIKCCGPLRVMLKFSDSSTTKKSGQTSSSSNKLHLWYVCLDVKRDNGLFRKLDINMRAVTKRWKIVPSSSGLLSRIHHFIFLTWPTPQMSRFFFAALATDYVYNVKSHSVYLRQKVAYVLDALCRFIFILSTLASCFQSGLKRAWKVKTCFWRRRRFETPPIVVQDLCFCFLCQVVTLQRFASLSIATTDSVKIVNFSR